MVMKVDFVSKLGIPSEKVSNFYRDFWNRSIMLADKKFYEWQFKMAPKNNGLDNCMVAYDEKAQRVIGVMGLNERDFLFNGESVKGAELTTWIVDPSTANRGAGAKILETIVDRFDFMIGMGITEQALSVYMRKGFRFLSRIPRYIRILDLDAIKEHCQMNSLGPKLVAHWSIPNVYPYEIVDVNDQIISTANKEASYYLNLYSRNVDDIQWRFNSHPYFEYKIYAVRSPSEKHPSIVVMRVHETKESLTFLHLIDVIGPVGNVLAVTSFVEDFARNNKIPVIDFYCTAGEINRFFIANKWFSTNDDMCIRVPHLFSPIELREPPTTSVVYQAKGKMEEIANMGNLYISKSDADLDRPTPYDYPINS